MRLIQPNCRMQFTAADLEFILEVLGPELGSSQALESLLADEETRDLILDHEKLVQAVLERRGCLGLSTHLYFYVLVRHVLRGASLEDRTLADYVAGLLTEFSRTDRTLFHLEGQPASLEYFCDLLAALQRVDDTTRFYIRVHMGNSSLFLSGIFPDRIRHRTERRGAPSLEYYEQLGCSSFRAARDHRLARRFALSDLYDTLAERFRETRQALNDLGDRLVSLGDPDCSGPLASLHPHS